MPTPIFTAPDPLARVPYVEPSFPTTPNTPTSYNLFGSDNIGNFKALPGTDDVVVCSDLTFGSTRGIKRVSPAGVVAWTWVNGGSSPGYYSSYGFTLSTDSLGNTYWSGRYQSGVGYVSKIDVDGVTVFNQSMNAAITGFNSVSMAGAQYDEDDGVLWVGARDGSPSMTYYEFDPSTGAFLQFKTYETATWPPFVYVDGHLITTNSTTGIKKTRISDDTMIWSQTTVSQGSGNTLLLSQDKSTVYHIPSAAQSAVYAYDVATGVELWSINFQSNPDYGNIANIDMSAGGVCLDKNGDIYLLVKAGTTWAQIVRLDSDGNKIYASDTDFGVRASGNCLGIAVSEITGTVFTGDPNGNVWTFAQT